MLDVPEWPGNDAGQHLDVRLTAPDGYQAQRSYSIASAGSGTRVELAVDELPDGEVSPFLVEDVMVGDKLELHGPLGGYFVWMPQAVTHDARPVQLIAGGSGVVPFLAMVRAHADAGDPTPFRLLYAVRQPDDVFYRQELAQLAANGLQVDYVYSRTAPHDWPVPAGRITKEAPGRIRDPGIREAAGVHLRVDRIRRTDRGLADRARARGRRHPHRAIRRQ